MIVVLGVGQLVLPPLADRIARDRLARNGRVLGVDISAIPAIELLFGDADRATLRLGTYRASPNRLAANLSQTSGIGRLDVSVQTLNSGLLTLHDVHMAKRGAQFSGSGRLAEAALRQAVPLLESVTVQSGGDPVILRGTANLPVIGPVSAEVVVSAENGKVVVSGLGLLGSFLHLTVWSDPRVYVESVSGRPGTGALILAARWRLR